MELVYFISGLFVIHLFSRVILFPKKAPYPTYFEISTLDNIEDIIFNWLNNLKKEEFLSFEHKESKYRIQLAKELKDGEVERLYSIVVDEDHNNPDFDNLVKTFEESGLKPSLETDDKIHHDWRSVDVCFPANPDFAALIVRTVFMTFKLSDKDVFEVYYF